MGCKSSKSNQSCKLEGQLSRQTAEIESLRQTNAELRHIVEQLISDNKRQRAAVSSAASLQDKIASLELKVEALTVQLDARAASVNDTFSRGSAASLHPIVLQDEEEERPVFNSISSHSILEDPLIKEILERKRLIFRRKERDSSDLQLLASPTMTSTVKSSKPA